MDDLIAVLGFLTLIVGLLLASPWLLLALAGAAAVAYGLREKGE